MTPAKTLCSDCFGQFEQWMAAGKDKTSQVEMVVTTTQQELEKLRDSIKKTGAYWINDLEALLRQIERLSGEMRGRINP